MFRARRAEADASVDASQHDEPWVRIRGSARVGWFVAFFPLSWIQISPSRLRIRMPGRGLEEVTRVRGGRAVVTDAPGGWWVSLADDRGFDGTFKFGLPSRTSGPLDTELRKYGWTVVHERWER